MDAHGRPAGHPSRLWRLRQHGEEVMIVKKLNRGDEPPEWPEDVTAFVHNDEFGKKVSSTICDEFEHTLEEGYGEAWEMCQELRMKNEKLNKELDESHDAAQKGYEEYLAELSKER